METILASSRRMAAAFLALLVGAGALIASADQVVAGITPVAFEQCLLDRINADRVAAGVPTLDMAADKTDAVRAWSEWMRHHEFRHMNATERAPILPPDWTSWGENIAWTSNSQAADCSGIHRMLMDSDGHRANILSSGKRFVALGAHVDGSGWWVTQVFFDSPTYSPTCEGRFCDTSGSVFEADIEALAAAGITKGCNPPVNDRFCPGESVTRAQMAAFLVRALDL